MKRIFLFLGLGLFFTHEMDAMSNQEWRVIPIINALNETTGEFIFLIAHVPIFALIVAFITSLNQKTRLLFQKMFSGFLIVHGVLHYSFSGQPKYEFSSVVSHSLIYGAAICGLAYFLAAFVENSE